MTHATLSNWEYYEIIRNAADPTCARKLEHTALAIDALLGLPFAKRFIKSLFGLEDLAHDDDFVSVLEVRLQPVVNRPRVLTVQKSVSSWLLAS